MLLASINPDLEPFSKARLLYEPSTHVVRNFEHKYAIIYCNGDYQKLNTINPGMKNLRWTKNDLRNARATVAMLGIEQDHLFEFIDSNLNELRKFDTYLMKIIL